MPGEVTAWVEPLKMTLYVAAARAAARTDLARVSDLRRLVLPALDRYRAHEIDESAVMDLVDEAMGGAWELPEDFQDQLDALGFTRRNSG